MPAVKILSVKYFCIYILIQLLYFRPNGMTYTDERFSSRWKERRARFLGCIENTKLIAERTKQRQENARIERLKKERAEMEKYRRRFDYLDHFITACFYPSNFPLDKKRIVSL